MSLGTCVACSISDAALECWWNFSFSSKVEVGWTQGALATSSRIMSRLQELSSDELGQAGLVREVAFGTTKER